RPTHGWIPFSDTGPAFAKTSFAILAVAGPMARSLEDLMLALSVLAADNEGWQKGNGNLGIRQGPIRAAFTLSWNGIATDEKSSIRIQQFLNDLRVAGHEVREIEVPFDPVRLTELWGLIVGYEMRSKLPWLMRLPPMIQMFDHLFNRRRLREGHLMETVTSGFRATRKDYEAALKEAIQGRLDFSQKISKFDVWVTPVSSGPAVTHCAMGTRFDLRGKAVGYSEYLGNFLTPTTVLHNPILSAPLKSVRGELPINVQLQGQPGEDWKLLHQAKRMEGLFSNGLAIPG
ncbi:MAG: amidase family protein, partial [Bdellovibrionales bacterium]